MAVNQLVKLLQTAENYLVAAVGCVKGADADAEHVRGDVWNDIQNVGNILSTGADAGYDGCHSQAQ